MPPERRKRSARRPEGRPAAAPGPRAPGPARPPEVGLFPFAEEGARPLSAAQAQPGPRPAAGRGLGFGLWHLIFFGCLLALGAMAAFVIGAASAQGEFELRRAYLARPVIFDGVSIDGLSVGGLTRRQAEALLGRGRGEEAPGPALSEALDAAYAVGRQGFAWMIGSDRTPFDIRWEHTRHIARTGLALSTRAAP